MNRSLELIKFIEQLRITDLIDFLVVWAIIYGLLKLVRGTRAVPIAIGLLGVGLLYQVAVFLGLETLQFVMRNMLLYFGFALLVIFAPEVRSALMRFGANLRQSFLFGRSKLAPNMYEDIVLAAMTLSSKRVGALIVIERNVGLQNYIETGVKMEAALSYDLLVTIFEPRAPLHDGAAIIRDNRLAAGGCFLPLTLNPKLAKELGTRHRAAIGVTEDTDAVTIVVSEETGVISFVEKGEIIRYLTSARLRELIREALTPTNLLSDVLQPKRIGRRTGKIPGDSSREQVSETFIK
jgi:diadenylate cyclase